jgi:hypothetical protein
MIVFTGEQIVTVTVENGRLNLRKSPPRLTPKGKELKIPWREKNPERYRELIRQDLIRKTKGKLRNTETKTDREEFANYKRERGLI